MGDMADFHLQQMMDHDDLFSDYQGQFDREHHVVCKYCGTCYLKWRKLESGWRLFTREGAMHSCRIERERAQEAKR